ncbi:hypothetical protein FJY94_05030 [Candidatus Kaiserbacteria bacterium]|nr:hypothetical protein [Candidatus Kaiserbacteria bacterium]
MSNLSRSLVAFHREEPLGASFIVSGSGAFVALVGWWSHGWFETDKVRVTWAAGILFGLWIATFIATIWYRANRSRSRALPAAIVWFFVAMIQLGVTAHFTEKMFLSMLYMSVFAFAGYLLTTYQLWEKHTMVCAEKAKAALSGREARLPLAHGTSDVLVPKK